MRRPRPVCRVTAAAALSLVIFVSSLAASPIAAVGLDTVWLPPLDADGRPYSECTAAVVFLHGLGDTSAGWAQTLSLVQQQMPHVCFVLPTADERRVTLNGGRFTRAWYDMGGEDLEETIKGKDGDADGIAASAALAARLVMQAAQMIREAPSRVVVGGFSQGAVVALHAGLTFPQLAAGGAAELKNPAKARFAELGVAGVLSVGGYLGGQSRVLAAATRNGGVGFAGGRTPVLMLHGSDDDVVPIGLASHCKEKLKKVGAKHLSLSIVPKMRHGMNDQALDEAIAFLRARLPPDGERSDL